MVAFMEKGLHVAAFTMIFLLFFCLLTDIAKLQSLKEITKDSLDLSTKAATMQVDLNSDRIGEGVFLIDNDKARDEFIQLMALNLNTSVDTVKACMIDYEGINPTYSINPSTGKIVYNSINYTDPSTGKIYSIDHPTFVASIKFRFTGLLIKQDIVISNNFGGSQLVSIN